MIETQTQTRPFPLQSLFSKENEALLRRQFCLPDVEWLIDGGDDLHLRPFWQAGFIPFALNGRGDAWCFCPAREDAGTDGSPVALCCHDFPFAQLYAPSFSGWIYRRILDVCRGDYGLEEVRLNLWIDLLCPMLPVSWVRTLEALKQRPAVTTLEKGRLRQALISESEYDALVARHLNMSALDQIFEWRRQTAQVS